jgi:hypothetical protein
MRVLARQEARRTARSVQVRVMAPDLGKQGRRGERVFRSTSRGPRLQDGMAVTRGSDLDCRGT